MNLFMYYFLIFLIGNLYGKENFSRSNGQNLHKSICVQGVQVKDKGGSCKSQAGEGKMPEVWVSCPPSKAQACVVIR